MIKNYVLDTCTLLSNPESLFHFEDNNVIVPIGVIEELDRFKKDVTELGRNARQTSRYLDELREKGDLREGVVARSGGKISVRYNGNLNSFYKEQNVDLHVLHVAQETMKKEPDVPCIIVSRDLNVRIRANALGIKAENHETDRVHKDEINKGYSDIELSNKNFEELISNKEVDISKCIDPNMTFPNYYFIVKRAGDKKTVLGRVNKEKTLIKRLMPFSSRLPIVPKNKEQNFLFDALLDKDIKLVSVAGKAGSGKTICAIALANYMMAVEKSYKRLLVSRPVFPMGKDIGFLPGEISEKLDPWMTPIYDAFDVINDNKSSGREFVKNHPAIIVEPLTYIRGRSIHDQILIVDECLVGDSLILTENGRRRIDSLFNDWLLNKNLSKVRTFNEITKTFEMKKIKEVKYNGKKQIIQVNVSNRVIKCTENHPILTKNGWVDAGKLKKGDIVLTTEPINSQICFAPNSSQMQILLGSYLGDGHFHAVNNNRYRLAITHGHKQLEYNQWKAKFFDRKVTLNKKLGGYSKELLNRFVTTCFAIESPLPSKKTYCPQWVLDNLDERGLAIWFMDNGSWSGPAIAIQMHTESFDMDSQIRIQKKLRDFGIDSVVATTETRKKTYNYIRINKEGGLKLFDIIKKYIPECMSYKIANYDNTYLDENWKCRKNEYGYTVVDSVLYIGQDHVFNLEVEDNHNFIVCSKSGGEHKTESGVIVHNCQNLSALELKTIISRAGENTKIILTGDIHQIDNPYIDSLSNGLSVVIAAFRDSAIATSLVLERCVRSELAEEAADRL